MVRSLLLFVISIVILESCGSKRAPVDTAKEDSFLTRLDRSRGFQGISLGDNVTGLHNRMVDESKINQFESLYSFLPTQRLSQECNNDITIKANTHRNRIAKIEIDIYCPDYSGVLEIFKNEYGDPDNLNNDKAIWESGNTYLALRKISDSTTTAVYIDKVIRELIDSTATPAR